MRINWSHITHMLRRKASESGIFGAFEDREGSRPAKRHKEYERDDDRGDSDIEQKLETLVFGKAPFQSLDRALAHHGSDGDDDENASDEEDKTDKPEVKSLRTERQAAAWHDSDDDDVSVNILSQKRLKKLRKTSQEEAISGTDLSTRLRTQFEKLTGGARPEWASIRRGKKKRQPRHSSSSSSEEEEEDEFMQRTGDLLAPSSIKLPPSHVSVTRLRDLNRTEAVVQCVEFHPSASIVLTAGFHKTLDLIQVDGQANPKLHSLHIQGFPITCAHFTQDGREVVLAGRKRSFHVYDMVKGKVTRVYGIKGHDKCWFEGFKVSPDNSLIVFLGKDGYMPLVSNRTKQWIGDLKMNGTVKSIVFTPDSKHLLSSGSDGRVYVWDLSTRDCVHSFTDEGCLLGTSLAVAPNNKYVACGSDCGVVNVYDGQCLTSERPTPLKSIMNLTTSISCASFNPSSELLAFSSKLNKGALRLLHFPSLTVFSNWPQQNSPLGHVSSLDISPQGTYLSVGNDKGRALLYRLNHYCKGSSSA